MVRQAAGRALRAPAVVIAALVVALGASAPAVADTTATAFDFGSTWSVHPDRVVDGPVHDPGFVASGWAEQPAPFGNADPYCGFPAFKTSFAEHTDFTARKTFRLPPGAHSLHLSGTIDNYVEIWLNGQPITSVWNGNCQKGGIAVTVADETLNRGADNVVVAYVKDEGVVTFFDLKATYRVAPDTTPPVVTVPADLTVDATGPAGATVAFEATATDAFDGDLPAACSPASGSLFPIGTTTVTCTATDKAGNAGTATFTVSVAGASEQLDALAASVQGVGPGGSLAASVESVVGALARDDTQAACGSLDALGNKAGAQSGKQVTEAQATQIASDAERIGDVVGC